MKNSIEYKFIDAVSKSECPEFNTFELEDVIKNEKFIALTYMDGSIVGVYIFRNRPMNLTQEECLATPLWTIWEETN